MWFSCKLGPLIWGIGDCTLRAKSQVKLSSVYFALYKEQQHTQKQDFFRDYGVAEAPPGFQAGWSDSKFCLSLFVHFFFSSGLSV
jgi:hypothetical protein